MFELTTRRDAAKARYQGIDGSIDPDLVWQDRDKLQDETDRKRRSVEGRPYRAFTTPMH